MNDDRGFFLRVIFPIVRNEELVAHLCRAIYHCRANERQAVRLAAGPMLDRPLRVLAC